MITRTTTVGVLKNYRYNLNSSLTTMGTALGKISTQRNFNSFAENPALAARAFQLRNAYLRTSSQYNANDSLIHKYDVAWSALDGVEKNIDTISNSGLFSIIRGENEPDASGRNALGQDLCAKARDIVQTMNGRYGEDYVFGGAETLSVPFTWVAKENPEYVEDPKDPVHFQYIAQPGLGEVTVNGVEYTNKVEDADFEETDNPAYADAWQKYQDALNSATTQEEKDAAESLNPNTSCPQIPEKITTYKTNDSYNAMAKYKYLKVDGSGTNNEADAEQKLLYRGIPVDSMAEEDTKKLDYYMNNEKKYIDIGLGFNEVNGEVVPSSVTNSALQGIYYLGGYGTTSVTVQTDPDDPSTKYTVDNIPKNIVSIMNRLGTIMMNCDPDDGEFASREEEIEF